MRIRIPSPSVLAADPPLGPLLLLEVALVVAATALRAQYPGAEGDFYPGEDADISSARVIANDCGHLCEELRDYRARLHARLRSQQVDPDWPF